MFARTLAAFLAATFLAITLVLPAAAGEVDADATVESIVSEVLGLKSVTFGGRLFCDFMEWAGHEDVLVSEFGEDAFVGGTEFRAARVHMKGAVSERIGFFVDYDFAGGKAGLKDAYMEYRELGHLGNLRVGHIREPFGLEGLTSNRYTTFMEPGLHAAFYPWRNTGVMFHDTVADGILTWQAGVFRDSDSYGEGSGDDEISCTARVAGAAWRTEDAEQLVHLGASWSYRNPDGGIARFKAAPENHMGPVLVDTGEFDVDSVMLLGLEAAVGIGPAVVQGEYVRASADRIEQAVWRTDGSRGCCGDEVTFSGYTVQASWVLTGERRPFAKGSPGRLTPERPLGEGGRGALELAVRYSALDLSDESGIVDGGELTDTTVGVNWYTSANSRIMVNYVVSEYCGPESVEREGDVEGSSTAFLTRFQIDF